MSEFGKGLCYCLGLFLAHAEELRSMVDSNKKLIIDHPDLFSENHAAQLWFHGAGDHLIGLEGAGAPTEAINNRVDTFRKWAENHRFNYDERTTISDCLWAINEAKEILLEIDKAIGIDAEKSEWE